MNRKQRFKCARLYTHS